MSKTIESMPVKDTMKSKSAIDSNRCSLTALLVRIEINEKKQETVNRTPTREVSSSIVLTSALLLI